MAILPYRRTGPSPLLSGMRSLTEGIGAIAQQKKAEEAREAEYRQLVFKGIEYDPYGALDRMTEFEQQIGDDQFALEQLRQARTHANEIIERNKSREQWERRYEGQPYAGDVEPVTYDPTRAEVPEVPLTTAAPEEGRFQIGEMSIAPFERAAEQVPTAPVPPPRTMGEAIRAWELYPKGHPMREMIEREFFTQPDEPKPSASVANAYAAHARNDITDEELQIVLDQEFQLRETPEEEADRLLKERQFRLAQSKEARIAAGGATPAEGGVSYSQGRTNVEGMAMDTAARFKMFGHDISKLDPMKPGTTARYLPMNRVDKEAAILSSQQRKPGTANRIVVASYLGTPSATKAIMPYLEKKLGQHSYVIRGNIQGEVRKLKRDADEGVKLSEYAWRGLAIIKMLGPDAYHQIFEAETLPPSLMPSP